LVVAIAVVSLIIRAAPARADNVLTVAAQAIREVAASADETGIAYNAVGDNDSIGLVGRWHLRTLATVHGKALAHADAVAGAGVADRVYVCGGPGLSVDCASFSRARVTLAADLYLIGPSAIAPWHVWGIPVMPAVYIGWR
jgi:hypothetical protein